MMTHFKNRLLVTSLALAAAGVLTCIACVIDALFPRGSLLSFLGWMGAASVAIAIVMMSFAWSCEKVDEHDRSRRQKSEHDGGNRPRAVTCARDGHPTVLFDRASRPATLHVAPRLLYYPIMLRGTFLPRGNWGSSARHGQ